MAMSAEHITGGNPPGADATQKLEVIEGSPEPFFNPETGEFDHLAADSLLLHNLRHIAKDRGLTAYEKSRQIMVVGINDYFRLRRQETISIDSDEASRYIQFVASIKDIQPPTDIRHISREAMIADIEDTASGFSTITPIYLLNAFARQSLGNQPAVDAKLATEIWVIEHSELNDQLTSHYDELRDATLY